MSNQSPPRRPRLSLQIKALSTGPSVRTSRTLAAVVNPRSPTSFNTLSNVYSTAIDRSVSTPLPVTAEPVTAINMRSKGLQQLPQLQLPSSAKDQSAHTPYVATQFPETPLTARPMSPAAALDIAFPSTMTATPPLSAGPVDQNTARPQVFCFSPDDIQRHNYLKTTTTGQPGLIITSADGSSVNRNTDTAITDSCSESSFAGSETADTPFPSDLQSSPPQSLNSAAVRRRITAPTIIMPKRPAPYEHPRSLHSILRNSPLPPFTALSPTSTRRQSQRLLEKASRHVMYNSPLTQTITTNLYTKSHIDLLCEEASPFSSPMTTTPTGSDADTVLDLTLAYSGNETRDGGTTPGPFEEMRRRMAGLGTSSASSASSSTVTTPISPGGIRKRKQPKKDKKRRWVWTLGQDDEDEAALSGAMAALKAARKTEAAAVATPVAVTAYMPGTAEIHMEEALADSSGVEADLDLNTPLAQQPTIAPVYEAQVPPDIEMEDSVPQCALVTDSNPEEAAAALTAPQRPTSARKRKSTPTPYATDSECESGADDEGDVRKRIARDVDVDMHTPTTALGNQLQGAWMQAATATAGFPGAGSIWPAP